MCLVKHRKQVLRKDDCAGSAIWLAEGRPKGALWEGWNIRGLMQVFMSQVILLFLRRCEELEVGEKCWTGRREG
jgi:hypothetical protein